MAMRKRCSKYVSFLPFLIPLFIVIILYVLGFRYVVVLTDSMEPNVPRGSFCVVAPTWFMSPEEGSVVLYEVELGNSRYVILHRIVKIAVVVYTKGDNRGFVDPWVVSAKNIIGVCLFSIPVLGYILLFLKIIAVFVLVFATVYYFSFFIVKRALYVC